MGQVVGVHRLRAPPSCVTTIPTQTGRERLDRSVRRAQKRLLRAWTRPFCGLTRPAMGASRTRRHRSVQKKLAPPAWSGEMDVSRQATWGMQDE